MTTGQHAGICPSCERPGAVGTSCPERVCARREIHYVPTVHMAGQDLRRLDTMVGQTIDEYLIVRVLGAGGFGKVYLALQLPILLPAALPVS